MVRERPQYISWCVSSPLSGLEPAAHLDPGPGGHDVYGGVGHSLGLSSVPLDTLATLQRIKPRDTVEGGGFKPSREHEKTLVHCRRLLVRYLAGIACHDDGKSRTSASSLLSSIVIFYIYLL